MDLDEFLSRLSGVSTRPSGAVALCPAHHDQRASLSVAAGEYGGVVFHCHAGCIPDAVISALHLTWADVNPAPRIVAEYAYEDATGHVRYVVERWVPKDFRCRPGLPPPAERILYGGKWISYARTTGQTLYVVEGEKDADALHAESIPATTNVGGAGKWLPHYSDELYGLNVIVVADDDEPGRRHAREVAAALKGKAASVVLRRARIGKDLSDHRAAGFSLGELEPLEQEGELVSYVGEDLQPEPVAWAWLGYMALGALSIIEGDPGDGKSVLTCDLAARWSSGTAMPDGSANPLGRVPVVMVSAEDHERQTISPRLRSAGADMSRVHCVVAGVRPDVPFDLSADLERLEAMVVRLKARVIVIDPLMAFLGEKTDSHNDASVRRALAPLALMARRRGVAVVLVRHLNKGGGSTKAVYRGGGSIGVIGAARSAFLVNPHPEDESRRVLACVKSNLARKPASLVYAISVDPTYDVARVDWHGRLDVGAQELLDGGANDERPAEVVEYLRQLCCNGSLSWRDITRYGKEAGYTEGALRAARSRVLTKHYTPGEGARGVEWGLKDEAHLQTEPHLQQANPDSANAHANGQTAPDQEKDKPEGDTKPRLRRLQAVEGSPPLVTNSEDDEYRRDAELAQLPATCQLCGEPGLRYGGPHWVVRCRAHNPMTYRGAS